MYHYHSAAPGPLDLVGAGGELYGILCDGTLVLGCTELDGTAVAEGDFDAQSGHVHDIVDEGGTTHFSDRYHTHLCDGNPSEYVPEIQYYDGDCPEGEMPPP
jgi:hypothetical protein